MTEVKGVTVVSEHQGIKSFVPCDPGKTSDGYHTFDELYRHRCLLFAALMKCNPSKSWRSCKHDDGSEWDGWFIAGMQLPVSEVDVLPITYHLPIELWKMLEGVPELETAPPWDGHTSDDVCDRLEGWIRGMTIQCTVDVFEEAVREAVAPLAKRIEAMADRIESALKESEP